MRSVPCRRLFKSGPGATRNYMQVNEAKKLNTVMNLTMDCEANPLMQMVATDGLKEEGAELKRCWLKTKGDHFKEYVMELGEHAVVLTRPRSSKQQALSYDLNKIQVVVGRIQTMTNVENCQAETKFCLMLITSPSQQRSIFFSTEKVLNYWHRLILTRQGFYEDRTMQYQITR